MKFSHVKYLKMLYFWLHQKCLRLFSNIFSRELPVEKFDNVLIFSPHPDDEVFGCAYLIKELTNLKKTVNVVFLSKGENGDNSLSKDRVIEYRKQMAIASNNILGLTSDNLFFLDFPDGKFDNIIDKSYYKEQLKNILKEIRPRFVFVPHPYENSPDHVAATKLLNKILEKIEVDKYYYCVWVWHHMRINKILKLDFKSSYIINGDKKVKYKAIKEYLAIKEGVAVSGNFPLMFLNMFKWKKELYFKD